MFKYELHCHTASTSACSLLSAQDIVDLYLANGYDGVVISDHFLNGNTTVNRELPNGTYQEKIDLFFRGYEQVKEAAKGKLKVFFAFEASYCGTDILAYGFNKETLKAHPEIPQIDLRDFADLCKDLGVLAVQAHPFREASYIPHIRLYTNCEGVETLNASSSTLCNDLGYYYAKRYDKIITGGSDIHCVGQPMLSGMAFDEEVTSVQQLVALLRAGKGQIIYAPNVYKK